LFEPVLVNVATTVADEVAAITSSEVPGERTPATLSQ